MSGGKDMHSGAALVAERQTGEQRAVVPEQTGVAEATVIVRPLKRAQLWA